MNLLSNAKFVTGAHKLIQLPADEGSEVAFAGRSNAGKSTALNRICNQRALARTSKTPGRTQQINCFELSEDLRLCDLPGYGFAKMPDSLKKHWSTTMARYLTERKSLKGVVLIMDIRHPLKPQDLDLLDLTADAGLPCHILLSKCDKLGRGAAMASLHKTLATARKHAPQSSGQLFSGLKNTGVNEARVAIERLLMANSEEAEAATLPAP